MNTENALERLIRLREKRNVQIQEKNAKFKAMPRMKQRVALAKEVLSIISGHRIRPTRRVYVDMKFQDDIQQVLPTPWSPQASTIDVQALLPRIKTCRVCMIGIAAIASIRARDGAMLSTFSVGTVGRSGFKFEREQCTDILSDLFDMKELKDMENFFEVESGKITAMKSVELFWKQIIKNKGEYKRVDLDEAYLKQIERDKRSKVAA